MRSVSSRARETAFETKLGRGPMEEIHEVITGNGNDLAGRLFVALRYRAFFDHQTMKIVWALSLCLLTMLAMPVYWYLYVWKKTPAVPPSHSIAPPAGAGIQSIA